MARNQLKDYEGAEKDALAALTLTPGNKDCDKLLKEVRSAIGAPTELEVTPEEPKKVKKKIEIEEVDSSPEPVAAEPKKAKKKIQIEEVDSSPVAAAEPVAEKKKAKKKIQIEE